MKKIHAVPTLSLHALAAVLTLTVLTALALHSGDASAQSNAQGAPLIDPPRWTQEDKTPQARYATSKKEAGAAYQEALSACRQSGPAERPACLKDARATYAQDLAEAKKRLSE